MNKLLAKQKNLIKLYSKQGSNQKKKLVKKKGPIYLGQKKRISSFHLDHYKYQLLKRRKKFYRRSDFLLRLKERKKLAFLYGNLSSAYIKKTVNQAAKQKGTMMKNLLILLEARLDVILYRICFFKTIPQARQYISHGLILVNGFKVDIPSAKVKPGDIISVVPDQVKKLQAQMCTYLKQLRSPSFFGPGQATRRLQPMAKQPQLASRPLAKQTSILASIKTRPTRNSSHVNTSQIARAPLQKSGQLLRHSLLGKKKSKGYAFNLQSATNAWIKNLASPHNMRGAMDSKVVLGLLGRTAANLHKVAQRRSIYGSLIPSKGKSKYRAPLPFIRYGSYSKQVAFQRAFDKQKTALQRLYKNYTQNFVRGHVMQPLLRQGNGRKPEYMRGRFTAQAAPEAAFKRPYRLPEPHKWGGTITAQADLASKKKARKDMTSPAEKLSALWPLKALKIKQHFLVLNSKTKRQRARSLSISCMKPLNLEVSYRLLTAIYLYSPQKVAFPALLDLDLVVRSLR